MYTYVGLCTVYERIEVKYWDRRSIISISAMFLFIGTIVGYKYVWWKVVAQVEGTRCGKFLWGRFKELVKLVTRCETPEVADTFLQVCHSGLGGVIMLRCSKCVGVIATLEGKIAVLTDWGWSDQLDFFLFLHINLADVWELTNLKQMRWNSTGTWARWHNILCCLELFSAVFQISVFLCRGKYCWHRATVDC